MYTLVSFKREGLLPEFILYVAVLTATQLGVCAILFALSHILDVLTGPLYVLLGFYCFSYLWSLASIIAWLKNKGEHQEYRTRDRVLAVIGMGFLLGLYFVRVYCRYMNAIFQAAQNGESPSLFD
jgi:hypothetical protein